MAKKMYMGVDSVARNIKKQYIGVSGISRKVKKGYIGVNGVARQFLGSIPLSELEIGTTVFLNVGGVRKEFIIIQKGTPLRSDGTQNTVGYENCDGTWLLIKDIYELKEWDSSTQQNDYVDSDIRAYLNTEFLALFDETIQESIFETNRQYTRRTGSNGTISMYPNKNKVFLLNFMEVGLTANRNNGTLNAPPDTACCLEYFTSQSNNLRVANYNGSAAAWWLSSISTNYYSDADLGTKAFYVNESGAASYDIFTKQFGIRPAIVLPEDTIVDY